MQKQLLRSLVPLSLAVALSAGSALPALAQGSAQNAALSGFYGGVVFRDAGTSGGGVSLGAAPLAWNRFSTGLPVDDGTSRSLVYGGYRWLSDIAVEAAFNTSDSFGLKPRLGVPAAGPGLGLVDTSAHNWNADIYTTWEFVHNFSLYGRLGYAQSDSRTVLAGASLVSDPHRQRDGVNYGVGLRYDLSQSLGLRVEYARYSHFAGDSINVGVLPESDQVTLGFQYKF